MATVTEKTARALAANDGKWEDDPIPFAVIKYLDTNSLVVRYAICYREIDFIQYQAEHWVEEVLYKRPLGIKGIEDE
jgi:hypothetical protein